MKRVKRNKLPPEFVSTTQQKDTTDIKKSETKKSDTRDTKQGDTKQGDTKQGDTKQGDTKQGESVTRKTRKITSYKEPSAGLTETSEFISLLVDKRTNLQRILDLAMDTKPKLCDFDYLHSMKPITKTSASDTSVFLATVGRDVNAIDIASKVFYTPVGLDIDNSLIMEQENYKLMNQVIINGWTPHLIAYVASFVCPEKALTTLPPDVRKNIMADLAKAVKTYPSATVFNSVYNVPKQRTYSFLFTEQAQRYQPLKEWICNDNISLQNIKSVLFQTLYTLEVFNRIGFRHNDPHAGNVLIEDHSHLKTSPDNITYEVDGMLFQWPTKRQFVKLFDFDRSYFDCDTTTKKTSVLQLRQTYRRNLLERGVAISAKKCNNTALDNNFCAGAGECNRPNPKYDTFLMLKSLVLKIEDCATVKGLSQPLKETLLFIRKIVDGVPKQYIHNEPPKFPDGYWLLKGNQDYIPTDDEMPSTMTILKSDFFSSGKVKRALNGEPKFSMP